MFFESPNAAITTPERRPMGYEFYKPLENQASPIADIVLGTVDQQAKAFLVREFVPPPSFLKKETPEEIKFREEGYWDKAIECNDRNFKRWLVILNQLEFIDWTELPHWKIKKFPNIKLVIALAAETACRATIDDEKHESLSGSGVGKRTFNDIVNATSSRCWINRLFKICFAWGFEWNKESGEFTWADN